MIAHEDTHNDNPSRQRLRRLADDGEPPISQESKRCCTGCHMEVASRLGAWVPAAEN